MYISICTPRHMRKNGRPIVHWSRSLLIAFLYAPIILLQNDADYWLLSDAEVSITDMWRTDCILFYIVLKLPL